jgi:hypothetical protein
MKLDLEESDRQLVLLALAVLSLKNPGFDDALNEIAKKIDNVENDRAKMYDGFRELRRDTMDPTSPWGCRHPLHKIDKLDKLGEDET